MDRDDPSNIILPSSSPLHRQHPLENPLILSHIFSLCPPSQLKICRLVCHGWYKISLPNWRSSFPLKFTENNGEYFMTSWNFLKDTTLHQFLEYVETPENEYRTKPHRDIFLRNWIFGRGEEEDRLIQRFWDAVSPGMTKLKLVLCRFTSKEAFRRTLFQRFPNLRELVVNSCSIWNNPVNELEPEGQMGAPEEIQDHPIYEGHRMLKSLLIWDIMEGDFLELLEHFPWISSLTYLGTVGPHHYRNLNRLLKEIRRIRKGDKRKLPLTHFDCSAERMIEICGDLESHETLALIRELRIPLKYLKICVAPDLDDTAVTNALEFHKETIRQILIARDLDSERGPILHRWRFPTSVKLLNLRELHMDDDLLENLEMLGSTPNLEELCIYDSQSTEELSLSGHYSHLETGMVSRTSKPEMAGVRLLKLKELRLEYIVSDEDVHELTRWMPNVGILAMIIMNEKQFEVVCENLQSLEELRLISGSAVLTDEMVCGMGLPGEGGVPVNESVRRPNITNLQSLRTIQFGKGSLTDVSAVHGFLHLPKLTQIAGSVKFGKEARKTLSDRNVLPFKFNLGDLNR